MNCTPLTLRQKEILKLLAEGLTSKEVGKRLGIAESSVKNTMWTLRRRLGLKNITEAVAVAVRQGWIV